MKYLILIFAIFSFAQAKTDVLKKDVEVERNDMSLRFYFISDYSQISSPSGGTSLSGLGFSLQGLYALSEKWGVGMSARQAFSLGGTGIVTSFDARLTYALTGKLKSSDQKSTIDGASAASIKDFDNGGLRIQFVGAQYYFNASSTTVPYSGMGLAFYNEHTTDKRYNYLYGIKLEQLTNTGLSTLAMSGFFGMGFLF